MVCGLYYLRMVCDWDERTYVRIFVRDSMFVGVKVNRHVPSVYWEWIMYANQHYVWIQVNLLSTYVSTLIMVSVLQSPGWYTHLTQFLAHVKYTNQYW